MEPTLRISHEERPLDLPSEFRAIVAAFVGGMRYGVKIRLPHAFLMTLLFRKGISSKEKLRIILRLVGEHSSKLAYFAALYKASSNTFDSDSIPITNEYVFAKKGRTLLSFIFSLLGNGRNRAASTPTRSSSSHFPLPQSNSRHPGYPGKTHHAAIAGAIGGYIVWGKYSSINYQILLYLASRVLVGMVKLGKDKGVPPFCWKKLSQHAYPLTSALVWSIVMFLFEEHPDVLHPSLKNSMDELYRFQLKPFNLQISS